MTPFAESVSTMTSSLTDPAAHPIFLSVTTPHTPGQESFVAQLEDALRACGLRPRTLGRNEWSFEAPLIPIRRLMRECCGTVVVAMVRTLVVAGIDYPLGPSPNSFRGRYLATAWTQLEGAMAFQLGHPLLLLKQEEVAPEGILDPAGSGLLVCTFALDESNPHVPPDVKTVLPQFAERATQYSIARTHPN